MLIAVHRRFVRRFFNVTCTSIEQLFVKIFINSSSVVIGAVYIPPDSDLNVYISHGESLLDIISLQDSNIVIVGDYNLPYII